MPQKEFFGGKKPTNVLRKSLHPHVCGEQGDTPGPGCIVTSQWQWLGYARSSHHTCPPPSLSLFLSTSGQLWKSEIINPSQRWTKSLKEDICPPSPTWGSSGFKAFDHYSMPRVCLSFSPCLQMLICFHSYGLPCSVSSTQKDSIYQSPASPSPKWRIQGMRIICFSSVPTNLDKGHLTRFWGGFFFPKRGQQIIRSHS